MSRVFTFNHNPLLSERMPVWRARFILLGLMGCSVALTGRALYLQGVNEDFLQQKGAQRYSRVLDIPASRGRILDRNGEVLAVSTPVKSVWADQAAVKLDSSQARQLARVLKTDSKDVATKLGNAKNFVYLQRQVSPDVADQVAALKLPGVHTLQEYRRFYPAADVTAHLLGFTNFDDRGLDGLELAMEKRLAGKTGARRVLKDLHNRVVEEVGEIRPESDGHDINLALDAKIQYLAHRALKDALFASKAKAGGVVVLDVKTGEILAMTNLPTYNPNNREGLTGAQLRNRTLTDTFEPGSTMKPFPVALALEQGKVQPETLINCNNGRITIGGRTISDAHPHSILSVAEVIQKSSNIGTVKISQNLDSKAMWQMLDDVGFGSPLRVGLPGEVGGRLRPVDSWKPIEKATMSYGHGISVTLLQIAHAYLTFARDGDVIPLSLLRQEGERPPGKQIFSPQTVHHMRSMLETVLQDGGTAPQARVPGYRAAGKTGTAYKLENGKYVRKYVSSFVGFAPVSDPRLVVAVMIDEPSANQHYGGQVAGPVFSQIMGGALRNMGVPTDESIVPLQVAKQNAPIVARENM